MWCGWDYIHNNNIGEILEKCKEIFLRQARRINMNLITVSGPPSSGKTSLIIKTIETLKARGIKVGVVKFDCLYTDDDKLYEKIGVPVKKDFQVRYVQTTIL